MQVPQDEAKNCNILPINSKDILAKANTAQVAVCTLQNLQLGPFLVVTSCTIRYGYERNCNFASYAFLAAFYCSLRHVTPEWFRAHRARAAWKTRHRVCFAAPVTH
jgi:hypothetical protein